jgi:hypothetical protein
MYSNHYCLDHCTLLSFFYFLPSQDRSNVHKGNRGSPVSNLGPPQLGSAAAVAAAAAMMPHASYEIPSSHHMRPHHPLQYSAIIRPPPTIHHMTPHLGRVTNDMGPPIFMPCEYNYILVTIIVFTTRVILL